jgi:hypothetical protein
MGTQGKMLLKGEEAERIGKKPWSENTEWSEKGEGLKHTWEEKAEKGKEWF